MLYLVITATFHLFRPGGKKYKHRHAHLKESVKFDRRRITLIDDDGKRKSIPWRKISEIRVEKAAHKPSTDSCDWIIMGEDESKNIRIDEEARGMDSLTARMKKMPGFDTSSLSIARRTTSKDSFLIWIRK